uniref:Uncharacterized protein n=1 Tax=Sphaerodactylus townsendi TaxID=933632 RepID=A0ACB8EAA6_9SAUR
MRLGRPRFAGDGSLPCQSWLIASSFSLVVSDSALKKNNPEPWRIQAQSSHAALISFVPPYPFLMDKTALSCTTHHAAGNVPPGKSGLLGPGPISAIRTKKNPCVWQQYRSNWYQHRSVVPSAKD